MRKNFNNFVEYCPDTGKFFTHQSEDPKGSLTSAGYVELMCGGTRYYAHRLAWYLCYKYWPIEIDHINGDKQDNRISNLREVTHAINTQNIVRPKKNNKTGYLGVTYSAARNKYYAGMSVGGKKKYLGSFNDPEEAHQVYLKHKREYHAGCSI